jgi:hypothetical protein
LRDQPNYAPALCVLGLIDAALGRKEDALCEGRRAMQLLPVAKDTINGGHIIEYFAITCAWAGAKDLAIETLSSVLPLDGHLTYGYLKLHPFWDPLRADPRFEKIVASLAPNELGAGGAQSSTRNLRIADQITRWFKIAAPSRRVL